VNFSNEAQLDNGGWRFSHS